MDENEKQKIRELLREHDSEFRGVVWMPRNLMDVTGLTIVTAVVTDLVEDVKNLNFDGLPVQNKLEMYQHKIKIAYEKLRRNRLYNQVKYFRQVGRIFDKTSEIFEELKRLDRQGYFES